MTMNANDSFVVFMYLNRRRSDLNFLISSKWTFATPYSETRLQLFLDTKRTKRRLWDGSQQSGIRCKFLAFRIDDENLNIYERHSYCPQS